MDVVQEAADLIERHGRRAPQVVVDSIVEAIRQGEDREATRRGTVLRAVDEALQKVPRLS